MAETHRFFNPDGSLGAALTGYESFGEMLAQDRRHLVVMRPLVFNVPVGSAGWTQGPCPQCGEPCWATDKEPKPLPPSVTAACTKCALLATGAFKDRQR